LFKNNHILYLYKLKINTLQDKCSKMMSNIKKVVNITMDCGIYFVKDNKQLGIDKYWTEFGQ